jgi:hypothetical protein
MAMTCRRTLSEGKLKEMIDRVVEASATGEDHIVRLGGTRPDGTE